jgi:hypothetical protein
LINAAQVCQPAASAKDVVLSPVRLTEATMDFVIWSGCTIELDQAQLVVLRKAKGS